MRRSIVVSKWFVLLVSAVLFIFAPSLDIIVCSDCSTLVQGKSSQDHLCSYCFSTAALPSYHNINVTLLSFPINIDGPKWSFSGPSFPIYKPPQN